jgi:TRAP-type transport system periplasmic protein
VVDMAENGINVYDSNKHYEVAPIMSLTGHEANCNLLWVSDKVWSGLSDEQKGWVTASAAEVAAKEPAMAIELEHKSRAKLEKMGVKFVDPVDKSGFIEIAKPLQEKIAADLGPHATKILQICRSVA